MVDVADEVVEYVRGNDYRDARGRAMVGYVYLTAEFVSDIHPRYASLEFTAATTNMSKLFEKSASVQAASTELTVASGGVCCLLDREWESLEVRWLNGETCREPIPGPRYAPGLEVAATWPA